MKIIVGLGNPGEKYKDTRHNLGFRVVEELVRKFMVHGSWFIEKKFKSEIAKNYELSTMNSELLLVKPQTFMNNSGHAVRLLADYYKVPASDIIVIYDDFDLPVGKIKVQQGGSAAGHHGVESVIEHLKDEKFIRIRLGIGLGEKTEYFSAEDFVLERFTPAEELGIDSEVERAVGVVQVLIKDGLEAAQNQYN